MPGPGSLDPAFGTDGTVTTTFGDVKDSAIVKAMTLQSDGKILVTGYAVEGHPPYTPAQDFPLVRYNTDGTLDSTFGQSGIALLPVPSGGEALAVQPDARILVAAAGTDFILVRTTPSGKLDATFGASGKVVTDFGGNDTAEAVALRNDGRILVGGSIDRHSLALARYLPGGTLDASFGSGGKVVIPSTASLADVSAMALQADGKIDVVVNNSVDHGYVMRLNADGSPDTSFGSAGVVDPGFYAKALVVLGSGGIVVGGSATVDEYTKQAVLAFYTPDGQLFQSAGSQGQVRTSFTYTGTWVRAEDTITAIAQQRDGKIVVAANVFRNTHFPDGHAYWGLARYSPQGALDATFASGGVSLGLDNSGMYESNNVAALALQGDGKIILAGGPFLGGLSVRNGPFVVARYLSDPPVSISGIVFFDSDANGHREANDSPIAGRTAYVDLNRNDQLDPGEPTATTMGDGLFQINDLAPGLDYVVQQVLPYGWSQTSPPDNGGVHMNLETGQNGFAEFGTFGPVPVYNVPTVPDIAIVAERYDAGPDGVAFHDTTPETLGAPDRAGGVDFNPFGRFGYSVGYTAPGEWLGYTIDVASTGTYTLLARVANLLQGGTFHLDIDGVDLTGPITVPDTGGWSTFQDVRSKVFDLSQGRHFMQVRMDKPGYWGNIANFDYFRIMPPTPRPLYGYPFPIEANTIYANKFDTGGEGVAYHDTTPQNLGGSQYWYRLDEAVDINPGGSNGLTVGYTAPGEWLNYSISAAVQATYTLQARVANYKPGGTFHVEIDGQNVTGAMAVPDSGSWNTWTTISSKAFTVSPGNHAMRVVMDTGGYWGNVGDFDSFQFVTSTGPFKVIPFNINADTIEAEYFNKGGEGVGYHDTSPGNQTGLYRPDESVDINNGGNNGYSVGYTAPGEWLAYSITNPSTGLYSLEVTIADLKPGGTFHVEIDGKNVTGALSVPDTGGWFNWRTITSPKFNVSAGDHMMKVVLDTGGYWGNVGNFDRFRFVGFSPFRGQPFNTSIDTIEAEQFDNGGEGIAYRDTTPGNQTGSYRPTEGVDINAGGSNNFSVGYTAPGEWLSYTIIVPMGFTGSYTLQSRVANYLQGGTFHMEIDGVNKTGSVTVPDTGGWFNWTTLSSAPFTLSSGWHLMRIVMDSPGYWGNVANFDFFKFVPTV